MAWIRIRDTAPGQHPSEVAVKLITADGTKQTLYLDKTSIENGAFDIGYPVGEDGGRLLVELPRETTSGQWRVWLNKSDVLDSMPVPA